MKKRILVLALALVLSMTACGIGETPSGSENNPVIDVEAIDFGALMAGGGGTDIVWGKQDEATKQQIIAEAKKDGVDVSFGADGSMTVVDSDGSVIVQNPDGTWSFRDPDGGEAQLGGSWPDNAFTKLLPKPDFEIFAAGIEEDYFTAVFNGTTLQDAKAYADALRGAGFTLSESVEEETAFGYYCFMAGHAQGYQVELSWAAGTLALVVSPSDGSSDDPADPADPTDPISPEDPALEAYPEIPFDHEYMGAMEGYYAYSSSTATVEEVRAYVQTLRDAGFTLQEQLTDEEYMGYVMYSFAAYHADGTLVMVSSTGGYTAISFTLNAAQEPDAWPEGLPAYPYGAATDLKEGAIAIYGTTLEEMKAYIDLLKQTGFVFGDFYDSGMTEAEMLASLDSWNGTNGTLYIEIGYGFGDLGLGYGETGTVTIIYGYEQPSIEDIW